MSLLEDFFVEIDDLWPLRDEQKLSLPIIGSAALMLQASYQRGTKDADVLEVRGLTEGVRSALLELAGKGTEIHARYRMYIDIVKSGLPFLPQIPAWNDTEALNARLRRLALKVLDVTDVVVSKLKRFNANDVQDISAMVDSGLVTHEKLISRFREAIDYYQFDARAEDLPTYVTNLHVVERDFLGVDETEIELPSWIA